METFGCKFLKITLKHKILLSEYLLKLKVLLQRFRKKSVNVDRIIKLHDNYSYLLSSDQPCILLWNDSKAHHVIRKKYTLQSI